MVIISRGVEGLRSKSGGAAKRDRRRYEKKENSVGNIGLPEGPASSMPSHRADFTGRAGAGGAVAVAAAPIHVRSFPKWEHGTPPPPPGILGGFKRAGS